MCGHTRCLDNAAGAAMHGVPVLLLYWGSLFSSVI